MPPVRQVGPYEVLGEVGRGGLGVVLRARAPDGREVALKLLQRVPAGEAALRFARERQVQGELGAGEGFVPLLDAGDCDAGPYLVMPLLPGGTLAHLLERGPLAPAAARALGVALASAVGRAHARGIVHRDLKPENVLFDGAGRPLIADLGLAKQLEGSHTPGGSLSRTGELRGTFGYMAPEQMRDAKTAGPPADVFALGAILYECLAGEPPFAGDAAIEVMHKVDSGQRRRLRAAAPHVPPGLAAVVERALALRPAARHPDAAALAEALERASDAPARGRAALVIGALGAALVVALAAGGLGAGPAGDEPPDASTPVRASAAPAETRAPASAQPGPRRAGRPLPAWAAALGGGGRLRPVAAFGTPRWKNHAVVRALACAGDAHLVGISYSEPRIARWRLSDGEPLPVVAIHSPPTAMASSPEGDRLLLGCEDGSLTLFELPSCEVVRHRRGGHTGLVVNVAFGPDGALYSAGDDGLVLRWPRRLREPPVRVLAAERQTHSFAYGDGVLALGFEDGEVLVMRASTLERLGAYRHDGRVMRLAIAPGGGALASGDDGGTVGFLELGRGAAVRTHDLHAGRIHALAFLPGGDLLSGASDGALLRVDPRTWEARWGVRAHTWNCTALALSPDGQRLYTGGDRERIRVFDLERGVERSDPVVGHEARVTALAWLGGERLASASDYDATVRVWDLATGQERPQAVPRRRTQWAISPAGTAVAVAGELTAFDVAAGTSRVLARMWSDVYALGIAPGGRTALTAMVGELVEWDLAAGAPRRRVQTSFRKPKAVVRLAEDRVALAGEDGSLTIVDLAGGGEVVLQQGGRRLAHEMIGLPVAGEVLIYGAAAQPAERWDLLRGRVVQRYEVPAGERLTAATAVGERLIALATATELTLRELASGAEVASFRIAPLVDGISALAAEPTGERLWVGTNQGLILELALR